MLQGFINCNARRTESPRVLYQDSNNVKTQNGFQTSKTNNESIVLSSNYSYVWADWLPAIVSRLYERSLGKKYLGLESNSRAIFLDITDLLDRKIIDRKLCNPDGLAARSELATPVFLMSFLFVFE